MDLLNFIVWLTTGAVIGWFAKRLFTAQHDRKANKTAAASDNSSEKS